MLAGTPLQGQVALVTGGGSGIGYAIAKALLGAGATVVICGRSEEKLHHAAQTLAEAGPVHAYRCDIRSLEDVTALADRIQEQCGALHLLSNSAREHYPASPQHISLLGGSPPLSQTASGNLKTRYYRLHIKEIPIISIV
ncbi:MAG: SDR family NAD(P)-dependent oxidoreductase [Acidobacteria bacterium]|nr:MAG: SDR family NAD(P)-dependent oxidoreductase [Acidobacteriota bacterium]